MADQIVIERQRILREMRDEGIATRIEAERLKSFALGLVCGTIYESASRRRMSDLQHIAELLNVYGWEQQAEEVFTYLKWLQESSKD